MPGDSFRPRQRSPAPLPALVDKRVEGLAAGHARSGRHASAPSGRVPTTATAGESERKPAPGLERLLIVVSVAEGTPPHRDVHPGMRAL
jgi:hypothetical protein